MSLLGIDIGTTGCKMVVLSVEGTILASARREYNVLRTHSGWAELDSGQVWLLIQDAIREVASQTAHDPIVALCVSSMGEAITPVSANREILGHCMLGFDCRGTEATERLAALDPVAFFERSGNCVGGVFGGPKLIWLRDYRPDLFEKTYKFLFWADLVAYLLGGEPITDYSLANRSLFFDLRRAEWSGETLGYIGMPRDKLPGVTQAGSVTGTVSQTIAEKLGLQPGTKIVIGAHDQSANAVGAGVTRPGMAVYGLGTFICITPTYATIPPAAQMMEARLNVEHHALPGLYVSFYYNLTGGALLKWFRDTFAQIERDTARNNGQDVYDLLLAEMPDEPTNLMVLPHFAPTGPPHFDDHARGLIAGVTLETTRGEIIKGLLEGVTYYFRDALDRMSAAGIEITEYRVTGGGARSNAWLQIKSDILARPLVRPQITEAGALGAAILAGLGAGVYGSPDEAIKTLVKVDRVFEPDPRRHALYEERFARYPYLYPFMQKISF